MMFPGAGIGRDGASAEEARRIASKQVQTDLGTMLGFIAIIEIGKHSCHWYYDVFVLVLFRQAHSSSASTFTTSPYWRETSRRCGDYGLIYR
jgi:hypothetical protein